MNKKGSKPAIRILHGLARSGGTLVSRCIGCMQDIVLLSEVHPDLTMQMTVLEQADQ